MRIKKHREHPWAAVARPFSANAGGEARLPTRPGKLSPMTAILVPRRLLITLAVAALLLTPVPGLAQFPAPPSFRALVHRVLPSVVAIAVTETLPTGPAEPDLAPGLPLPFPPGIGREEKALGSGFIIDPSGIIVTNDHVVAEANHIVVVLQDGEKLPARRLGTDLLTDLAVIKVNPPQPLPAVAWGNSNNIEPGDWILAAGNPFGLGGSVSAGIVSARGRNLGEGPFDDFLQLDAAINPGNSGGPSFDTNGLVIGVNTAIVSPSGGSVGIGFAIPSNLARKVVAQLIAQGHIPRGWLGVSVEDSGGGVLIAAVIPDGPAARAGLAPGDEVLAVNGRPVPSTLALIRAVATITPGSQAQLTIRRNGRDIVMTVIVGTRPLQAGN